MGNCLAQSLNSTMIDLYAIYLLGIPVEILLFVSVSCSGLRHRNIHRWGYCRLKIKERNLRILIPFNIRKHDFSQNSNRV